MAYLIYNNDGTILLTLPTNEVDTVTTSLDLVGQNVDNYGQYLNNNLTKLLTNFASNQTDEPRSPQVGQLWFNKTLSRLTVYDGTSWKPTYGATISGTVPISTSTGDLWYDSVNSQLKIWNGSDFKLIGPAVSAIKGKFGLEPPVVPLLDNDFNQQQNVSVLYSYGEPVALVSSSTFDMSASSATVYLNTSVVTEIISGVTLLDNLDIKGDLYVRGNTLYDRNLIAYYDISSYGDPTASEANIDAGNSDIRIDLAKLFPTETISTLSQVAYLAGSEVRVLCNYSGATSVRRFRLGTETGSLNWDPLKLYYDNALSTLTNIVT